MVPGVPCSVRRNKRVILPGSSKLTGLLHRAGQRARVKSTFLMLFRNGGDVMDADMGLKPCVR